MRVQLLKSRFFPELRGPGPATPSPSSPQPRRVRPPVRRPRAGSGLRVVLGSRTGLPSGASPRDTRPDPRLQKPSGRGKGVGRRRAVAHHQRKERCHCCRVPLTTLSCSSYQQGNRHLLKSTMDEQKNIPERGCHRNCARRAAMHRENAPSKEERKEVILKLLFPSVLSSRLPQPIHVFLQHSKKIRNLLPVSLFPEGETHSWGFLTMPSQKFPNSILSAELCLPLKFICGNLSKINF
ncbi:uncharacterized protein LOC116662776 isoform X1 [Camelus ferus]|uniref:Uncharacterized protein LOC116662776 isoform X1 n=1 Tax=Camelus ferus TaxID=419612 RepID=A0A8B8ST91_CAMFR|nr:uncharacterized protein LOC116662776 isoform X1 [Camelus ferus]